MAFVEVGTSLSKIKANSLNLAGTFGFSGTVSGLADETPLVLISTFTSDGSDATASFTSGIDSTYKEYLFVFNDLHPETNDAVFQFQGSTDGGSSYGVNITSSAFRAYANDAGSSSGLNYEGSNDLAQSTNFQYLMEGIGSDAKEAGSGILRLYNPSSTTFVKHFVCDTHFRQKSDATQRNQNAGYFNTTSAINAIQFKMSNGEIQSGTIDLFGVV